MPEDDFLAFAANRCGPYFSYGGKLAVTSTGIRFTPRAFDQRLGGKSLSLTRAEISTVSIAPPNRSLKKVLDGGLTTRLQINTASSDVILFVVDKPAERGSQIRSLLGIVSTSEDDL